MVCVFLTVNKCFFAPGVAAVESCGSIDSKRMYTPPLTSETRTLDFRSRAKSKIGSLDNASHKPGGGDKQVCASTLRNLLTQVPSV